MDLNEREKIGLIGALVKKKFGAGIEFGLGVIIDARKHFGELQVKVGWFKTPYILFQAERKVGWQLFDALIIISKSHGDSKYVD